MQDQLTWCCQKNWAASSLPFSSAICASWSYCKNTCKLKTMDSLNSGSCYSKYSTHRVVLLQQCLKDALACLHIHILICRVKLFRLYVVKANGLPVISTYKKAGNSISLTNSTSTACFSFMYILSNMQWKAITIPQLQHARVSIYLYLPYGSSQTWNTAALAL